jgi:serine/threonine-protein kinase RsbW
MNPGHIPPSHHASDAVDAFRVAIEVWLPSDVGYIERVVEMVRRQVAEMHFDVRHVMLNVPVALTEALSNAILRGNREDPEKHVHVRALVNARQLVMEVKDEGRGFDIERCTRDPTRPENVEREDGRGLFLMRQLMDSVERYDENGNVVRLTLNRR